MSDSCGIARSCKLNLLLSLSCWISLALLHNCKKCLTLLITDSGSMANLYSTPSHFITSTSPLSKLIQIPCLQLRKLLQSPPLMLVKPQLVLCLFIYTSEMCQLQYSCLENVGYRLLEVISHHAVSPTIYLVTNYFCI